MCVNDESSIIYIHHPPCRRISSFHILGSFPGSRQVRLVLETSHRPPGYHLEGQAAQLTKTRVCLKDVFFSFTIENIWTYHVIHLNWYYVVLCYIVSFDMKHHEATAALIHPGPDSLLRAAAFSVEASSVKRHGRAKSNAELLRSRMVEICQDFWKIWQHIIDSYVP